MSYETPWLIRYMNTAEILKQIILLAMKINNIYLSFILKYLKAFLRLLGANIEMWHKNHPSGCKWVNHRRKTELHYSWQLAIVTGAVHKKKNHYPSSAANILLYSRQVFQHFCPNVPIYKIPNVESHVETLKGCQHNQSLWLSCCLCVNSMPSSVWVKTISLRHSLLGRMFPQHCTNTNSLSSSLANWEADCTTSLSQVKKLRWEAKAQ